MYHTRNYLKTINLISIEGMGNNTLTTHETLNYFRPYSLLAFSMARLSISIMSDWKEILERQK